MEFFEKHLLPNSLPSSVIWFRYIDDILCIWPNDEDVCCFLSSLNNLVPSIKFIYETEENMSLPFLDVLIYRCEITFQFDVYEKTTNILSYVHFYSSHHMKTKRVVLSSVFLRALRICCPEYINCEIEEIYDIATYLKYPRISLIVNQLEQEKPIIMSLKILFLAKLYLFCLIMTTMQTFPGS